MQLSYIIFTSFCLRRNYSTKHKQKCCYGLILGCTVNKLRCLCNTIFSEIQTIFWILMIFYKTGRNNLVNYIWFICVGRNISNYINKTLSLLHYMRTSWHRKGLYDVVPSHTKNMYVQTPISVTYSVCWIIKVSSDNHCICNNQQL